MVDFHGVAFTLLIYMGSLATLIYLVLFVILPHSQAESLEITEHLHKVRDEDIDSVTYGNTGNWRYLRKKIFEIQGNRCLCCGVIQEKMHIDHIRPKSLYPHLEYKIDNLQVLCPDCNRAKSYKDQTDYRKSSHLLSLIVEIHDNKLLQRKYVHNLDILKELAKKRSIAEIENREYKLVSPLT